MLEKYWKGLLKTSDLAYLASLSVTMKKCFITWTIGVNLIKLFFIVTDVVAKLMVFVLDNSLQPCLIFIGFI
jgi:hypothetical protein